MEGQGGEAGNRKLCTLGGQMLCNLKAVSTRRACTWSVNAWRVAWPSQASSFTNCSSNTRRPLLNWEMMPTNLACA